MVETVITLEIGQRGHGVNVHFRLESKELTSIIVLYCQCLDMEVLHDHSEELGVDLSCVMSQIHDQIVEALLI